MVGLTKFIHRSWP